MKKRSNIFIQVNILVLENSSLQRGFIREKCFFSEATQAGELANLTWRKDNWFSIFIQNIHFKIFCNQLRISFNQLKIICHQSIKDGNICLQVELSHRLDVHWYLANIIIILTSPSSGTWPGCAASPVLCPPPSSRLSPGASWTFFTSCVLSHLSRGDPRDFFHKPYSNQLPALITELCPTCPALSDLALLKRWNVPETTLTVSRVDNVSSGLSNQETPRRRNSLCDRRRLCLQRCTTYCCGS